jgi:hypothetical protein
MNMDYESDSYELYQLYDGPGIIEVVKAGILRYVRHLCRTDERHPSRKLFFIRPECTRITGRLSITRLDIIKWEYEFLELMRKWKKN